MSEHESFIRQCYDLAIAAARRGNHPFGALLVHHGEVILTGENTVNTSGDITRHAELNLVVEAIRKLPEEVLREVTLYTSTAPCLICTGTIWEAGISRIIYGVSYQRFASAFAHGYRYIPIDEVYRQLQTPLEITGPVLEDEGIQVYQYWPK